MSFGKWHTVSGCRMRRLSRSEQCRAREDGTSVPVLTVEQYQVHEHGRPDRLVQIWQFHDGAETESGFGSVKVLTYPMYRFWRELRRQRRLRLGK